MSNTFNKLQIILYEQFRFHYTQNLDFKTDYLGLTLYQLIIFRVQDFLKFQNPTINSTNSYHLKKLLNFFEKLQKNLLLTFFTDEEFHSLVTIPEVRL